MGTGARGRCSQRLSSRGLVGAGAPYPRHTGYAASRRGVLLTGSQPASHAQPPCQCPGPAGTCLADASAGLRRGDLPGGGWHVAWAPLPSAVSGGQRPGRMTRQVPTAPLIVWSLARLELDTVVLVWVHGALACGAAHLPLPPGALLPDLSPASRGPGVPTVTWRLGFRRHLTSSLTPQALPACCPGLFPDSLGLAVWAVG